MKIEINGVDVTADCVVKDDTIIFCGAQWPKPSQPLHHQGRTVGFTKELVEVLQNAIDQAEEIYFCEKESADWFNNNTPNVGITVQYQSYAALPKWVQEAKNLIALQPPPTAAVDVCEYCEGKGWYINEEHKKYPEVQQKIDCQYCSASTPPPGLHKPFIVANVREVMDKMNDEISFGTGVKLLNEIAERYYRDKNN